MVFFVQVNINNIRDIINYRHYLQNIDRSRRLKTNDISKGFDKVWHDGVIYKLKYNCISGSFLSFF